MYSGTLLTLIDEPHTAPAPRIVNEIVDFGRVCCVLRRILLEVLEGDYLLICIYV
jgi:hypothetical protein